MINYTHCCSGAGRFDDMKHPPDQTDKRMHPPRGWESQTFIETCPQCGDDAPVRGAYGIFELTKKEV